MAKKIRKKLRPTRVKNVTSAPRGKAKKGTVRRAVSYAKKR